MLAHSRWGRPLGSALALAALALALSSIDPGPAPAGSNPAYAQARALLDDAFDATAWSARLPADYALPRMGRAGLVAWVATLTLPDEVRSRVDARLAAEGFVDELVPFALFVKETYAAPEEPTFAEWARGTLKVDPAIPGWETSTFTFSPPRESEGGGGLPLAQAARFLRLYDAVYLQDTAATAAVTDRLVCEADDTRMEARMLRAKTIVRELLADQEAGMDAGDMKDAVGHVLRDDTTLEAITLSLIDFVDAEVCKHYRIFAGQVLRERQMNTWLSTALLNPERDDGWTWLRWHGSRHIAVQVVVDGLQGHLVESLASGASAGASAGPQSPFLAQVAAEDAPGAIPAPKLRSASPGPGMTTKYLHYAAEHGSSLKLPTLAAAVASPGFARHGISTTPTISVRNLPVVKTGAAVAGPGSTGIPNFHFVDRTYVHEGVQQGRPWYFYGNDALQLTPLAAASVMKTMFSRLRPLVTMSCGAQYDELAGYSFDGFLSLAIGETSRDFGDIRCVAELGRRAKNELRIAELRASLLARESILHEDHHPWELYDRWAQAQEEDAVRREVAELALLLPESMPDYLLYYNPWPDHFAHAKGPFADEIIGPTGELVRLDHWLGRITETYAEARLSDRTLFGMAGDHGLTPVRWLVSPEAEFIEGLKRAGLPLVVTKISSDEGEGPKLTHRLRPPSMRGFDLVVASTAGGNYMMDFFVDQGDNWARQPVLAELKALRTIGGKTIDVPKELLARLGDSLDYLVVREAPCTPDGGTVAAMGPRGGVVATATIERRGRAIWVEQQGADLLGLSERSPYETLDPVAVADADTLRDHCLSANREDPASWCAESEWRALTRFNRRPDAVTQLAHLYDIDRAGTVNLFPRDGVGYNTKVPGRHAGESFHEKDAFVGIWGASVKAGVELPPTVNGSLAQAMYAWISGTKPVEGEDGWGWPAWPEGLIAE